MTAFPTQSRTSFIWRHLVRLVLALLVVVAGGRAMAQPGFGLGVTTATNSVALNAAVALTLRVTNLAVVDFNGVFVTNSFAGSSSLQFVSATTSQGVIVTNAANVVFDLGSLLSGGIAQMTVTLRPTTAGAFTNTTLVRSVTTTNTAGTNVVVQVRPPAGDLAAGITGPVTPVLQGDVIHYGLAVTNRGGSSVSGVVLTNSGLGAMKLLSVSPAGQSYTFTNGLLVMNLGTLASQSNRAFSISVQPTNAGVQTLGASVFAASLSEADTTNNTVSTVFTVEDFFLSELIATNASSMNYNPQTGLMEQTLRLVNLGTNTVGSARVIVSGLTNRLYNAVGTNNGNPFVSHGAALDPGQGVDLLMEYFVPTRTAIEIPNSAYTAVGMSAVNWASDAAPAPNITRVENLGPNGLLIEFAAVLNRSYTIYYSSDSTFTNALVAQPVVVAPGDRVMWIDNGPPKTVSHPTTVGTRYYRVRLNP